MFTRRRASLRLSQSLRGVRAPRDSVSIVIKKEGVEVVAGKIKQMTAEIQKDNKNEDLERDNLELDKNARIATILALAKLAE